MAEQMRKRLVLCMGQYCNHGGHAAPLYDRLCQELGEPKPAFMTRGQPVSWETANCLSMCGGGPNLVVYPDDVAYNHLDLDALEQVIEAHLKKHTP